MHIHLLKFFTALSIISSIILSSVSAQTQKGSIAGMLRHPDGKPAADVYIMLKNSDKVTSTDENGRFYLKDIEPGSYVIRLSGIGIVAEEHEITLGAEEPLKLN